MRLSTSGLRIDDPSAPLLAALVSYQGITDAPGAASGLTIVCGDLVTQSSYDGHLLKIRSGPSAGQVKPIYVQAGNTLTFATPWTNAAGGVQLIAAGTLFDILSISGGGGGPGPAPKEGLSYYGVVDAVPGANQFTIGSLAGLGAGKFDGATNPYFAFVLRDAGGGGLAPQGEQQPITGYVTATGVFTTAAFTAAVGVGDEILIISPYLAAMAMLWAEHSGALAYLGQCAVGMAPSTNVMNCPNLTYLPAQTFTRGYQMIVLRNANAPGNPPEMEMRAITNFGGGLFATAAFSANVEENDILLIIHNSVAAQISAYGIADAGSGVGIVRDAARTEADDWWNGQTVMMLSGAARGQKRPIADFIAATDDIIPAPNFDAAVAAGDLYIILAHYNMIVPRTADDAANALTSDVVGRKDDTPIIVADNVSSIMRYLKGLLGFGSGKPNVQEIIIYPAAEDADTTELADDGTGPAYYPAVAASTNVVGEGAAVAAWTEDINFEQEGTITIISIYAEFEWQSRFLVGAGNGTNTGSKIQISRDGGANWVDLTDNYIHNNAAMTNRIRAGVGRWIPTIVAGANQLQFRLVHWVDVGNGISTSEAQIRSNSYIRITYRKS